MFHRSLGVGSAVQGIPHGQKACSKQHPVSQVMNYFCEFQLAKSPSDSSINLDNGNNGNGRNRSNFIHVSNRRISNDVKNKGLVPKGMLEVLWSDSPPGRAWRIVLSLCCRCFRFSGLDAPCLTPETQVRGQDRGFFHVAWALTF